MKAILFLAGALACGTSAALAQTVLPSGAVAPAGSATSAGVIVTPGTVPGSQPLATPDMRDGGPRRGHRRDQKAPGMTRQDKKELRKMSKVEPSSKTQ